MKKLLLVSLASLFLALPAFADGDAPAKPAKSAKKPKKSKKGKKTVEANLGTKADAEWTNTTTGAAATPAQKKWLKRGRVKSITGEVIEVSCYLQLGKRGEKHIPCGTNCLKNGQPAGILTDDGKVYMLMAEEHDPRRDGKVSLASTFIPYLAKRVKVTGRVQESKGTRAIFLQAGKLTASK